MITVAGYEMHKHLRLFIGPYQLVQSLPVARYTIPPWALPGGGRATTAQLIALARIRGWRRPRVIEVTVRYRQEPKATPQPLRTMRDVLEAFDSRASA